MTRSGGHDRSITSRAEGRHESGGSGTSRAVVICVAIAVSACAGLGKDTPEQEVAYARWKECAGRSTLLSLDRVEPNGRIMFSYYLESDRQTMMACLAKADQAGPRLPEAVGTIRVKGGA